MTANIQKQFNFGDFRLEKRANEFINAIEGKNSLILRQVANNWNEEVAYGRLIDNYKVTEDELIRSICSTTNQLTEGKHVLIISDTTDLNFELREGKIDLERLGRGNNNGLKVHSSIVLDATDGSILGLSDIYSYLPSDYHEGKVLTRWARNKLSVFEKSSGRWISSAKASFLRCSQAQMRTLITDREGDFYELFMNVINTDLNNHVLIRSSNNRILYDNENKLYEHADTLEAKAVYEVDLPKTEDRSKHTAKLEIRFDKVKIKRPGLLRDKSIPEYIELNFVDVRERAETVKDGEKPIHWRFLTTHEVENIEIARLIIDWYCLRWWIEQLFRLFKKKGINIEYSQVEEPKRLLKLLIFGLMASINSLQLTQARDGNTTQKLHPIFTEQEIEVLHILNEKYEGKTEKQKNPHPSDNLAYGSWIIARIGGWKGYSSQSPAGPITMFEGLKKFLNIVEGYALINKAQS